MVQVDLAMILAASDLGARHSLSFWDALIVEAANRARATPLATADLRHGRTIAGVRIVNPFV